MLTRRKFMKSLGIASATLVGSTGLLSKCAKSARPNILWLIAEDLSPDLGCYGEPLVHTPNIDALAEEGVRFTNAFTTGPVCSASRSAFMTGMYQTSIGAQNHRSHRRDGYRLPDDVHVLTDYFRKAGYFTANVTTAAPGVKGTGKTDWNFNVEKPFDGTDWNQRAEGQPFFAQVNFHEAHRAFEKADASPVDPATVKIPPYYPDDPITRKDWAAYLDTVGNLDEHVGAVLKRLQKEGLAENTIVFFFGDHGRAMVRAKQWLYDPGIHIPLIIRWPGKFKPGSVRGDLVSAIDFGATCMHLAGIRPPENMQGCDFLGKNAKKRDYIIAARDRCDETVDRIRCVRTKQFKYIKNFYPEQPYSQLNRYKETMYPVLRLMRRLNAAGQLTHDQAKFMAATRPPEELYDLQNDPDELHNLADSPKYKEKLVELRSILKHWIHDTKDMGEIPEDPSVVEFYEQKMKKLYDPRLIKLYKKEKMVFHGTP